MQSYLQGKSSFKALYEWYFIASTFKHFIANHYIFLGLGVFVICYCIPQTARIFANISYPPSQVDCSTCKQLCFKSPIYIPPGRFLLWHQINLQFKCPVDFNAFLRVYLYFSQTSSDIRYPFALEP